MLFLACLLLAVATVLAVSAVRQKSLFIALFAAAFLYASIRTLNSALEEPQEKEVPIMRDQNE